jgi:hypothetical protein
MKKSTIVASVIAALSLSSLAQNEAKASILFETSGFSDYYYGNVPDTGEPLDEYSGKVEFDWRFSSPTLMLIQSEDYYTYEFYLILTYADGTSDKIHMGGEDDIGSGYITWLVFTDTSAGKETVSMPPGSFPYPWGNYIDVLYEDNMITDNYQGFTGNIVHEKFEEEGYIWRQIDIEFTADDYIPLSYDIRAMAALEPSIWMMLIGGFFAVGSFLRRQRRNMRALAS